ncbi:MAG: hypothetical protein EB034_21330, partial [Verrucomicrobia bacterium]|nr:hypothetical protein [Verrucomicrobiota bacterium]
LLAKVAAGILPAVEPWLPARRMGTLLAPVRILNQDDAVEPRMEPGLNTEPTVPGPPGLVA